MAPEKETKWHQKDSQDTEHKTDKAYQANSTNSANQTDCAHWSRVLLETGQEAVSLTIFRADAVKPAGASRFFSCPARLSSAFVRLDLAPYRDRRCYKRLKDSWQVLEYGM